MTTGPKKPGPPKTPVTPERKAEIKAAEYSVGYGKPPSEARFQKGQSGNPTGRPKGARALRTDLLEVLDIEVQVQLPSGPQAASMQKAMVLATAAKAVKGDTRAAMVIVRLMELTAPERLRDVGETVKLSAVDEALLAKMLTDFGVSGQPAAVASSDLPITDEPTATEDEEDFDIL